MAAKRQRRGTGSIVEVEGKRIVNGRTKTYTQGYRARATLADGSRISATRRTHEEARDWLDGELDARRNQKPSPSAAGKRQFSELIETWEQTRVAGLAPKTRTRYGQIVRTYIDPEFGGLPVPSVTRERIRKYLAALALDGISAGTIAKVQVVLSSIMSEAVENGIIATNPAARLKGLPKPNKRDLVILSKAEVQALADVMDRPQDQLAVLMLAHCGPRADELWALQRRDYNRLKGTVTIERAWKDTERQQLGPTKTGGKRVVGLPSDVRVLLDKHLATVPPTPDAFIFTSPGGANGRAAGEGGPVRQENWRPRVFNPARDKALPHHPALVTHDLRHCCASWLIASGADALQVMKWLGHASIATTFQVYGHLLPNHLEDMVARLEAFHASNNLLTLESGPAVVEG